MRRSVILSSTLRRPIQSLLLLLLLGLISFAFVARAVEYLIVRQETERLGGYYRSIGSLQTIGAKDDTVSAAAALVESSRHVAHGDYRRACSGVLRDLLNVDFDGGTSDRILDDYTIAWARAYTGNVDLTAEEISRLLQRGIHVSDVFVYGVLTEAKYDDDNQFCTLSFTVDLVEAGYPEYVQAGDAIRVKCLQEDAKQMSEQMEIGARYFIRAYYDASYDFVNDLSKKKDHLIMKPIHDGGPWFLPASSPEVVDFHAPMFVQLEAELAVLRENLRTMRVVATRDMSALPDTQEAARMLYLVDGRWLNREDDLRARRVVVAHNTFAETRGLAVGDTISLTLRDVPNPSLGYIRHADLWTWRDFPAIEESFEIVGLYSQALSYPYTSTHSLDLYIPNACMPTTYDSRMSAGMPSYEYSFVLKSTEMKDAFLAENRDALADLGFVATFVENGADVFWGAVTPLLSSTATNASVFALLLLLALVLTTFLYRHQHMKEFAILRALGVPARSAAIQTLAPLVLLGAVALPLGGVPAWRYAVNQAAETLGTVFAGESEVGTATLSPLCLAAFIVGAIVLLLLLAGVGMAFLARHPALYLLQGQNAHRQADVSTGRHNGVTASEGNAAASLAAASPNPRMLTKAPPRRFVPLFSPQARFSMRQMHRAPLKSLLVVAVALCYLLAIGWMKKTITQSKTEILRMYESIVVEADIVRSNASSFATGSGGGIIGERVVTRMLDSGFVQSAYLEAASEFPFLVAGTPQNVQVEHLREDDRPVERFVNLLAFDDPTKFFARCDDAITVEYADGWDSSLFAEEWPDTIPAVLPSSIMQRLSLSLGDSAMLIDMQGQGRVIACVVAGQYFGEITHIGPESGESILLSMRSMERIERGELYYSTAEFILHPAQNRTLQTARAELKAMVAQPDAGRVNLFLVLWDEELREVIGPMEKNLALLTVLYPVTLAMSALISAGLALLLVLQSARDAAILRVLGTTKRKTCATLLVQQGVLCLLGLLAGGGAAHLLFGGVSYLGAGLYFGACILSALIGAHFVTRKKPLELLQVKE